MTDAERELIEATLKWTDKCEKMFEYSKTATDKPRVTESEMG